MTPETDAWGRRLTCLVCGERLRHPSIGRPRTVCPGQCQRHRRRQRTRTAWGAADWQEALRVWAHACAHCGQHRGLRNGSKGKGPPLPLCANCLETAANLDRLLTADARIREWVARCAPGCPLPRPREAHA